MQYHIEDFHAKTYPLAELPYGSFFEWNKNIYFRVDLEDCVLHMMTSSATAKQKIFALNVASNKITYFNENVDVTLLKASTIQFTRVLV